MARRQPWLTPNQAIDLLMQEHTPVAHELVAVVDDDGEREPTDEERARAAEPDWCDGCHRLAEKCSVMPILALVHDPWWQRITLWVQDNVHRRYPKDNDRG